MHFLAVTFAAFLLALLSLPAMAACEPMIFYADESVEEALREAAWAFSVEEACSVTLEFAATPALARRISEGGMAHLLLAAGSDWPGWLEGKGHIGKGNRMTLLSSGENKYQLALLGPAPHEDPRRLYAFLQSYSAAEIFVRHGFFRRE